MGSMPGGPGMMQPPPPGAMGESLSGDLRDERATRPMPGAPGPMDPPLADAMGATMEGGVDEGEQ
ncbi:MAG TPA: hypothetical protein VF196_05195, partial [Casimicrobiaceae bacterium]